MWDVIVLIHGHRLSIDFSKCTPGVEIFCLEALSGLKS